MSINCILVANPEQIERVGNREKGREGRGEKEKEDKGREREVRGKRNAEERKSDKDGVEAAFRIERER